MSQHVNSAQPVPRHVAIIMDGNGRWAKKHGKPRIAGHHAGAETVLSIVEEATKCGVGYLTLFSFSTENWNRVESEVAGLMALFVRYLNSQVDALLKNDIRFRAVGQLEGLPRDLRLALERDMELSKNNGSLTLILALNYGGRDEIVHAARSLARQAASGSLRADDIDADKFSAALWTNDIPDPDLLIRTSGEMRISNFLLWQLAYSEIVVRPEFWPDFTPEIFRECLRDYAGRERRYGRSSEQLWAENGTGAASASLARAVRQENNC
ncbi:MAG TPA: isoprenyl transferase [Oligoflexia bacterium]|nr:isoprenyl transferase [Oligoflexia bacterium]